MNNTIYKYDLQIQDRTIITMPIDAKILTVQMQKGFPCMWALLNPDAPLVGRIFWIASTGYPILFPEHYIGTFQNPPFVWHLFEEK